MASARIKSQMFGPYPLTPQMVDFYVTRNCGGYYRVIRRDGRQLWGIAPDLLGAAIAQWCGQFDLFCFYYFDDDYESSTEDTS